MSLPEPAFVSVVVPTYRDWGSLERSLWSLLRQRYPQDLLEVLVINNAPDVPFPPGFPWSDNVRLLCESKPGSYAARNRGVAEARGDILAFIDADCVPEPGWLASAIVCMEAMEADLVAGHISLTYLDSPLTPAECFEKAFAFRQAQNVADGVAVTANLVVRRKVYDDVGPFNAELRSGGDFEWTRRATARGHRLVYCEEAVVRHPARSSLTALAGKARRVTVGSRSLYHERGTLGNMQRVLDNLVDDMLVLFTRHDMTWRERGWALLVLFYLKGVKVAQRLRLLVSGSERRGTPR